MASSDSQTSIPDPSNQAWESSDSIISEADQPKGKSSPTPKLWLGLLFTVLVFGGGGWAAWHFLRQNNSPPTAQQPQDVPVKLEQVQPSTLEESSQFVGTLEAKQKVELRPEAAGRITRIVAASGDRVEAGALILQLKPERSEAELRSAIADVNAQTATLNNAQAEVRAAQADIARLKAEVGRQAAEVQSREADLELARVNYQRAEQLVDQGVQPRQELDDKKRDRNQAIAARDAAAQALAASKEALNVAQQRVQAAQATEARVAANLSSARADVEVRQEELQFNRVVAPIDGVVGDILVKVGDYVNVGDTLTTITQNQTLDVEIPIDEQQSQRVRQGLPVELRNQGTPATEPPIATGRISFISPQVNRDSQTLLTKATFSNPNGRLYDQQKVDARVIWEKRPGVLIPVNAVSRLAGKPFVFVAQPPEEAKPGDPELIAQQRPVTLGNIQGNRYQVLEGIEPGDRIVVSGILNLSDGAPIIPDS
ncbi:MAG: efflux RND transporter periplasmic adaptor subunit [Coleofasciculus sp. G1-WW12-02]|uniref:efflux RND transporter periplasmic adaptor subunit n=1 Tax=Coleofasciculus sp. G1-WW12-02 TaxID=3068483 RepID=UPI0032F1079D